MSPFDSRADLRLRVAVLGLLWSVSQSIASANTPAITLDYNNDIRGILAENCFKCHGADEKQRKGKLRLDDKAEAESKGAIISGKPEESEAIKRILSSDPEEVMPPPKDHAALSEQDKAKLQQWIREGAEYKKHWAFIPPVAAEVPQVVQNGTAVSNPIDAFVQAKLASLGLQSAAPASKSQWLRRVSYALTGLPPTEAAIDAYNQDQSPLANEKIVEQLLNSSAYGEQMARDWLDVSRYADSYGRHEDGEMIVWPWREWVIKAFNSNLPYDQFILWQTAGDLLQDATRDQIVATAFNRLAQQSNESGSDPEEFRMDQISDRVRTNGLAFMGLTIECAKCHDHKYDPISQKEYWQMAAFFDNIEENGVYSQFCPKATPSPSLLLPDDTQQAQMVRLNRLITQKKAELEKIRAENLAVFKQWVEVNGLPGGLKPGAFNTVASWIGGGELNEWKERAKAHIDFDDTEGEKNNGKRELENQADQEKPATLRVKLEAIKDGAVKGAVLMKGDDEITIPKMGDFREYDAFSFSLWLQPRETRDRQTAVACSRGGLDDGRGYEVLLENEVPSFALMHFHPGTEIRIQAKQALPLNQWTHLVVTYDGSSRAAGMKIYLNGVAVETAAVQDNLHKDIARHEEWGDIDLDQIRFTLGGREHDSPLKNCGVDDYWVFGRSLSIGEVKKLAGVESTADDWFEWWLQYKCSPWKRANNQLKQLRNGLTLVTNDVLEMMVMKERTEYRECFIRTRGDYRLKAERVIPGAIREVMPFSDDLPKNRLGLAKWLTDPKHPLTSRVAVNRIWQMFFGRGLVATPQDFGTRGDLPSHPELLDWLACDFMAHGWDVKRLCRMIALSSTFGQSSVPAEPQMLTTDADNKWLARGPRLRLSAEEMRDQALLASGLLKEKIGGPSVHPYIPADFYKDSALQQNYIEDTGEGLYRRSMYSFWRRTLPPPELAAFDAPSREFCVLKREKTSTPVQALVLLNSPQYVEAQRMLAERVIHAHPQDRQAAASMAFRLLTTRDATTPEQEVLGRLLEQQRLYFTNHPAEALDLLKNGKHVADSTIDPVELASTTMVIRTMMNHIEAVIR